MLYAESCALMGARPGLIAAALEVNEGFPEAMQLLKAGDRYFLTGVVWPAQGGHGDLKYEQYRNTKDFLRVKEPE